MRLKQFLVVLLVLAFLAIDTLGQKSQTLAQSALKRGNELFAAGRYEQAVEEYARVTAEAGDIYATALYNIGVSYYELWQTDRAISFYQKAIQSRKGRYPRALYALAVALEDKGNLREAEDAYHRSLFVTNGNYALANYRLGLLVAKTDVKRASEFFRKALEQPGEHVAAAHNNLGVMLARMRLLNEAERQFVVALRQTDGNYPDAAYNLKLCRRLLAGAVDGTVTALRVSGSSERQTSQRLRANS